MAEKDKEKPKEVTLPSDFVDGRKGIQELAAWATDHARVLSYMEEEDR